MTLSRKDVYATVIIAAGLLLALSVTQGWSWPLMNGVRAGILALGVAGIAACSASGWSQDNPSFKEPFMIAGGLLGAAALLIGAVGLFVGTMGYLVAMIGAIVLLWVVTVAHRVVGHSSSPSRPLTAA